jgi:hypothetical protein
MRLLKQTFLRNHPLNKINMRGLPDDETVLGFYEQKVLEAVPKEAYNPLNVPKGEIRAIEELDDFGQLKVIHHVGQESFVKQMGTPGRRVVSFNTPNGPVSASGMFLR